MNPQQQPGQPPYEQWINSQATLWDPDKSFTDKVLGRQDADRLRQLMQNDKMTRKDMSEILVLIAGLNQKLVNYNDWDRYILAKFFTWIREFVAGAMSSMSIKDELLKLLGALDNEIGMTYNQDRLKSLGTRKDLFLSVYNGVLEAKDLLCDYSKYLFDVHCYLANSTLSLQAAGFDTLTSSRFEYSYPGGMPVMGMPVPQEQPKRSVFSLNPFKKR